MSHPKYRLNELLKTNGVMSDIAVNLSHQQRSKSLPVFNYVNSNTVSILYIMESLPSPPPYFTS